MDLEKELEKVEIEYKYDEESMTGYGTATLEEVVGDRSFTFDKKDADFANQKTAETICYIGSMQNLLDKLAEKETNQEKKQTYTMGASELSKELTFYINGKTNFYEKLRKNRAGDTSDKIKTLHIHKDGTVEELV